MAQQERIEQRLVRILQVSEKTVFSHTASLENPERAHLVASSGVFPTNSSAEATVTPIVESAESLPKAGSSPLLEVATS
jgi:hypothetical protein